jgi:hypothetical protein
LYPSHCLSRKFIEAIIKKKKKKTLFKPFSKKETLLKPISWLEQTMTVNLTYWNILLADPTVNHGEEGNDKHRLSYQRWGLLS